MCISFIILPKRADRHKYSLILISNRDEFTARPTSEAEFWEKHGFPDILAGMDLAARDSELSTWVCKT